MRIRSLTVRRYRVHRELSVEFDAARTVIGGPNEAGKSTLAEAMQRALFLRARGNTEHHRSMLSTRHPGVPEVEIEIECGDETVSVRKAFGSSGSLRLQRAGRSALTGEDAEEALAEILGVSVGGAARTAHGHWGHVFIWQGTALADPLQHAPAPHDALIARLQALGGAAVVQSDLDARVARRFAEQRDAIFTQSAQPRAGSELAVTAKALERAIASQADAERRIEALEEHAETLERATRELAEAEVQREAHSGALAELQARRARLTTLEAQRSRLQDRLAVEIDRHRALVDADADIRQRDTEIEEAQAALKPRRRRLAEAKAHAARAAQAAESADAALAQARKAHRGADRRRALLAAKDRALRAANELRDLEAGRAEARKLEKLLLKLRSDQARLADVDDAAVAQLQTLAKKADQSRARLEAMAAEVAVVRCDGTVRIAGEAVGAGESRTVVDRTEIRIGRGIVLSIAPGGGTSLEDARRSADKAQRTLDDALAGIGVSSVPEAISALRERTRLEDRIASLEGQLEELAADTLEESLATAKVELAAAQGEVARLSASGDAAPGDEDPDRIGDLLQRAEREAEQTRDLAESYQAELDKATAARRSAAEVVDELQAAIDDDDRVIRDQEAELRLLVAQNGDEDARRAAIERLTTELEQQQRDLDAVASEIAKQRPEGLAADEERIDRVLKNTSERIHQSRVAIATAENALRSDGGEDPREQLAQAEAALAAAQRRHDAARRHADAIKLLDDLFKNEQAQLTERLTRPLETRIRGYLECIFGAGTDAHLVHGSGGFAGLRLTRGEGATETFAFESLSGGTREQVAAAVRLATAEILADDFHGCLPVILDDAFAYSDPDRVARLQSMLDLAAVRGLQVIVLTCNPTDYVGLGAKAITIRPETRRATAAADLERGQVGLGAAGADDAAAVAGDDPVGGRSRTRLSSATDPRHAELLAALRSLGGSSGNKALREQLGWDEATYERVKLELVEAGSIARGQGRGGSVRLVDVHGD